MPGWTQLASIVSSFLTVAVAWAEDFQVVRQKQLYRQDRSNKAYTSMTLGEKLPLLGNPSVVQLKVMR